MVIPKKNISRPGRFDQIASNAAYFFYDWTLRGTLTLQGNYNTYLT